MLGDSGLEKLLAGVHLEVSPGLCLRLRHKKSSCRLCLENCPCGAVRINGSLHVDSSLCRGCGICVNVCPTGVFELRHWSYESLLGQVREGGVLEFTCAFLSRAEGTLEVPCLGYLNEAVFTGAVAFGSQSVKLNISQCNQCDFVLGRHVAAKSIRQANRILSFFGITRKISASVGKIGLSHGLRKSGLYSRREFFSYLREGMQRRVAAAIENTNRVEGLVAKTKATLQPKVPKKRFLLLEHIKRLGQPVAAQVSADDLPFAEVQISRACSGCGMCVTFCPSGALRSYDQGQKQLIDFSLGHCLACNLCSDVCPENAVSYATYINPYDFITEARKVLIEHTKSSCQQCEQSYVAVAGSALCPECSKKKALQEWLAKILN